MRYAWLVADSEWWVPTDPLFSFAVRRQNTANTARMKLLSIHYGCLYCDISRWRALLGVPTKWMEHPHFFSKSLEKRFRCKYSEIQFRPLTAIDMPALISTRIEHEHTHTHTHDIINEISFRFVKLHPRGHLTFYLSFKTKLNGLFPFDASPCHL